MPRFDDHQGPDDHWVAVLKAMGFFLVKFARTVEHVRRWWLRRGQIDGGM
jgi:hypothetical protein